MGRLSRQQWGNVGSQQSENWSAYWIGMHITSLVGSETQRYVGQNCRRADWSKASRLQMHEQERLVASIGIISVAVLTGNIQSFMAQQDGPQMEWLTSHVGVQNTAMLFQVIANLLIPASFIYANEHRLHAVETQFLRGLALVTLTLCLSRANHISMDFKSPYNFRLLFIRSLFIFLHGLGFAAVQFYLPLPIVHTINSSGPLIVVLLDYLLNNVPINGKQAGGIGVALIGVAFTVNGDYLLGRVDSSYQPHSNFNNYNEVGALGMSMAGLAFLGCNAMWAYGNLLTKRFVKVNAVQINLHLGVFILASMSVLYPLLVVAPVDVWVFGKGFLWVGLPMATGHLLMIAGFRMTRYIGVATLMNFVGVIFGYIVSTIRYEEAINLICLFGSIFILLGLARVLYYK